MQIDISNNISLVKSHPVSNCPISTIPWELIFHIFSFLPIGVIHTCSVVCRHWYRISRNPDLLSKKGIGSFIFQLALNRLKEQEKEISIVHMVKNIWGMIGFSDIPFSFQALNNIDNKKFTLERDILDRTEKLTLLPRQTLTNRDLELIPRQVTKLVAANCHVPIHFIQYFPPGLTALDLSRNDQITDESLKYLPNGLKFLNVSYCIKITNIAFAHLPTDLEGLNVSFCSRISDRGLSQLPKSLIELDIRGCKMISNKELMELPFSIRNLKFWNRKFTENELPFLPPLVSLDITFSNIKADGLSMLPKTLRKLKAGYCPNMMDKDIQLLPKGLTSLNLSNCYIPKLRALRKLPPHLRTSISYKWLRFLPSTLTSLNLRGCDKIMVEDLKLLPAHLTKLNVMDCSISPRGYSLLPRNLTCLSLSIHWDNNEDVYLERLPARLNELEISDTCSIKDENLLYLPQELNKLQLAAKITDKGLKNLPPKLTHLKLLCCSDITEEGLSQLSSRIQFLEIVYCKHIKKTAIHKLKRKRAFVTIKI